MRCSRENSRKLTKTLNVCGKALHPLRIWLSQYVLLSISGCGALIFVIRFLLGIAKYFIHNNSVFSRHFAENRFPVRPRTVHNIILVICLRGFYYVLCPLYHWLTCCTWGLDMAVYPNFDPDFRFRNHDDKVVQHRWGGDCSFSNRFTSSFSFVSYAAEKLPAPHGIVSWSIAQLYFKFGLQMCVFQMAEHSTKHYI